jgi:hypothetical protein
MKGTKFGPVVIPGKPDQSNLFVLISGRAKLQMPYGRKPLPSCLQTQFIAGSSKARKTTELPERIEAVSIDSSRRAVCL